MNPIAHIASCTAAHGPVTRREVRCDRTRVYLAATFSDGTRASGPLGRLDDPGVFEAAKEWAGVEFCRLRDDDGRLTLLLRYDDGRAETERLMVFVDDADVLTGVPAELRAEALLLIEEHRERTRRHDAVMDMVASVMDSDPTPWLPSSLLGKGRVVA